MNRLRWLYFRLKVMSPREICRRLFALWRGVELYASARMGLWRRIQPSDESPLNLSFAKGTNRAPKLKWAEPTDLILDNSCGQPQWHRLNTKAVSWPLKFSPFISFRFHPQASEIRVLWERSRLQQLVAYGLAYRQSKSLEERKDILKRYRMELLSWWQANPPYFGIHYISSMECGLRLIAICQSTELFREGVSDDREVWQCISDLVASHTHLIRKKLSLGSSAGNHTIAECAGLVYASALFPEFSGSKKWFKEALSILSCELDRQVLPDGGGLEQSFWYLHFILDLGEIVCGILQQRAESVPGKLAASLQRGRDFLSKVSPIGAYKFDIGDRDDGHAISPYFVSSYKSNERNNNEVLVFEESGYTRIHDEKRNEVLLFDHGALGMPGLYGHAHSDALSLTFSQQDKAVLIDPGTYCYGGEARWRSYFRGTRSHNTVTVNSQSQAEEVSTFVWKNSYQCQLFSRATLEDNSYWSLGFHDGYEKRFSVLHWRLFGWCPGKGFVVYDFIEGEGTHSLELNWHLGVECEQEADPGVFAVDDQMQIRMSGGDIKLIEGDESSLLGWQSPKFGSKAPCKTLQISYRGGVPHEFHTVFQFQKSAQITDQLADRGKKASEWARKKIKEFEYLKSQSISSTGKKRSAA